MFWGGQRKYAPHLLPELPFEKINNGSLGDQKRIYHRFENNRRNEMKQ
jgi:hypothetical protein